MKRTYSKPDVVFESFSLSTSIATGCEFQLNLPNSNGCGYMASSGYIVFMEHVQGCAVKVNGGEPIADGLCYQVPNESRNLFDS